SGFTVPARQLLPPDDRERLLVGVDLEAPRVATRGRGRFTFQKRLPRPDRSAGRVASSIPANGWRPIAPDDRGRRWAPLLVASLRTGPTVPGSRCGRCGPDRRLPSGRNTAGEKRGPRHRSRALDRGDPPIAPAPAGCRATSTDPAPA